jgi:predicted nuclease with RNAse H fold
MPPDGTRWVGVDVGAHRKGFDVAVIDGSHVHVLAGGLTVSEVAAVVAAVEPLVVGIDSPCGCAPDGQASRECERRVAREICGIRWTPDAAEVMRNRYYSWVVHGLELYRALAGVAAEVIEVFPTASWTRWLGRRGPLSRSIWTRSGLTALELTGVPRRTNQDQRDAIAAAVTAHEHSHHATESFGAIVVPLAPHDPKKT